MSVKRVDITDIGPVVLMKRKGARTIRLSIAHNSEVRVTMPSWVPYQTGIEFVRSKQQWIADQLPESVTLEHKQRIGKAHHLVFEKGEGESISTRISGNEVKVLVPQGFDTSHPEVQAAAEKAAIRTLKKEAKGLLPGRLALLARQHGFTYRSVGIKQLTGRWGSCSSKQDIVLNCFLMQLPVHLIDYVIMHELVHTRIMAHGPVFWDEVSKYVPNLAQVRKEIKLYKPIVASK